MSETRAYDYGRLGPPEGARVVIGGGCGGIGSAVVKGCLETNLDVTIVDLAETEAQNPAPAGAKFIAMDAYREESVRAAFGEIESAGPALDALINLIGSGNKPAPLALLETESWDDVISRNLRSAFLISKAAMPLLKASGAGAIVHTASGAAYRGIPGVGSYTAAKAGLIGMTKTFAVENAPEVRANVIAPGGVTNKVKVDPKTGKATGPQGLDVGYTLKTIPLGRFADPEDLVAPFLFLAGPSSGYMTGQVLQLSGGMLTP
jgi:NAD(P)-dependent dehydrogenase (short-subunit alcohol dehydrogenase family)